MGNQWVGLTIDCDWAGPMARFYEGLLGFEVRDVGPGGRWAQLFHPHGGVHINIQGDPGYESPTWPEQPGELAKMMHIEVRSMISTKRSIAHWSSAAPRLPRSHPIETGNGYA